MADGLGDRDRLLLFLVSTGVRRRRELEEAWRGKHKRGSVSLRRAIRALLRYALIHEGPSGYELTASGALEVR